MIIKSQVTKMKKKECNLTSHILSRNAPVPAAIVYNKVIKDGTVKAAHRLKSFCANVQ